MTKEEKILLEKRAEIELQEILGEKNKKFPFSNLEIADSKNPLGNIRIGQRNYDTSKALLEIIEDLAWSRAKLWFLKRYSKRE